MIVSTWILLSVLHLATAKMIAIGDKNDFKKALSSHSNILVSFLSHDRIDASIVTLLNDVSNRGAKLAKFLTVNCQHSKKLCKQYKADPNPFVLHHFHKGKFNKVYDRKFKLESILKFLEDPLGDISWDEDETSKDVVHVRSSQDLQKIVGNFKTNIPSMMLMFYAPWCGYCKQMKPEFSAAATILKGKSIFIGINGDLPSTDDLKQAFNITGYPSVFLVQDGNKVYKFENENSRDALVKFVKNPVKPQAPANVPWAEETNEIDFLTDSNFNEYINQHESVVVMFYAPWCGHCKTMKPQVIEAAQKLKALQIEGRIAAVDATEQKNVSDTYKIKGFPTLKYFRNGEYQYDVNERTAEGLVNFLRKPEKPEEPKPEIPWRDEESAVIHPSADQFRSTMKKYKHSLVMFYAPWCGHCKATKPMFTSAANRMIDNGRVAFIAVDCTDESFNNVCSSEGVTGFPTLRYYNYGKNNSLSEYSLEREEDDFVAFMTDPSKPLLNARRHWRKIPGNEAVVILESENFVQTIGPQKGGALVMFYAPWCRHCISMKPDFVNAAMHLKTALPSAILAAVDASKETQLAAQYAVTGFPTLIYFSSKGDWMKYNGERKEADFIDFMIKKDNEIKEEIERNIREQEKKKAEEERKKIEEEQRKKREEEERKKIEEEQRKKREEEERKKIEEEQRKKREEEERKKIEEEQRKKREEEERKKIEEEQRKKKEKEERKKIEEEQRKKREEEERKKIEEEQRKKKEKEERKKIEEEQRKKREEEERQKKEHQRKKTEGEQKKKEEEERVKKAEENKKRVEEEQIKAKIEEEKERKKVEIETKKLEEKRRKKAEDDKKEKDRKAEAEKLKQEEIEKQVEEQKKKEQEDEIKKKEEQIVPSERPPVPDKARESGEYQLTPVTDEKAFQKVIDSPRLSIVYCHRDNRKSAVKKKLLKVLTKSVESHFSGVDVDCSKLVELCDQLKLVETPAVLLYRAGAPIRTLTGSWSEHTLGDLLEQHSTRDEL